MEKKHEFGYEICMASAEHMGMTEASPQMEDGNQPTVDDLEEINIEMCSLGLTKKCPD
jgi:hypothetical protein